MESILGPSHGNGHSGLRPAVRMVKDWSIRKRRPIRRKAIAPLLKDLEEALGIDLQVDGAFLEAAEFGPWKLVFVDKTPKAVDVEHPDGHRVVALTLRGLMDHADAGHWVEVDHGAIRFLMNGADCMAAGISGADAAIEAGDLVWIRDEVHQRPLALGWALDSGPSMVDATGGKAVKTIHWVGDELWDME